MEYLTKTRTKPTLPGGPAGRLELRDYQTDCLQAIKTRFDEGITRQLVALPTGSGKTVVFAHLPQALGLGRDERMLVLAHREELIEQAAGKLRAANPGASVGIEMAQRRAEPDNRIVVASVQSLVNRLDRHGSATYRVVICDEAHHAPAPTYRRIFEHFGFANDDGERLLVGFTATTKRGDGVGLWNVFEKITYQKSLREMIDAHWLVDIAGYRIETRADISGVQSRAGDFAAGQLSRAVNTKARNELVVHTYRELAPGRKALTFTVDVQHAEDLSAEFQKQGVNARAVSGKMKKADRRAIVGSYRRGDIDVLCNCALLTEGFDDPKTAAVLMARPTRSSLLYMQMLGRGTRTAPGKKELLLLDFVDSTKRHSAVSLPDLFGLNPQLNLKGRKVSETLERIEGAGPDAVHYVDIERLEARIERVDLFRVPELPDALRELTRLSWIPTLAGMHRLMLPDRKGLSIVQNALGRYEVYHHDNRRRRLVKELPSLPQAFAHADALVPRKSLGAVLTSARWRKQPPSWKQLRLARKLSLPVPPGATKGDVEVMISNYFAQRNGPIGRHPVDVHRQVYAFRETAGAGGGIRAAMRFQTGDGSHAIAQVDLTVCE